MNTDKKTRNRKGNDQAEKDYQAILSMLRDGRTPLEIMVQRDLSKSQFDAHLARAAISKEMPEYRPAYIVLRAKSLPDEIAKLLGVRKEDLGHADEKNDREYDKVLVKAEGDHSGVILSRLNLDLAPACSETNDHPETTSA